MLMNWISLSGLSPMSLWAVTNVIVTRVYFKHDRKEFEVLLCVKLLKLSKYIIRLIKANPIFLQLIN